MSKITVIIVDSQPFFRVGLKQTLSDADKEGLLSVSECDPGANGGNAIAQLSAVSPDVVLVDIGYPFLTGLDLSKRIVRNFPTTQVVVLSSNPEEDDDELFEAIKIGAVAYLRSNDCPPSAMLETIKRAASGAYPINDSVSSRPKVAWRVLRQFQDMTAIGTDMEELTTPLTPKEVQILTYIAEGNSNRRIATIMGISEQTIKNHVSAILRKLNANDRAHAVFLAIRNGWISIETEQEKQPR